MLYKFKDQIYVYELVWRQSVCVLILTESDSHNM